FKGRIGGRHNGVLVSMDKGVASTYAILQLEDRGENFMEPGTEVYEGMIVGQNTRDNDLTVNITKVKAANNIRSATKEQTSTMKKPRILTHEEALSLIKATHTHTRSSSTQTAVRTAWNRLRKYMKARSSDRIHATMTLL